MVLPQIYSNTAVESTMELQIVVESIMVHAGKSFRYGKLVSAASSLHTQHMTDTLN